MSQDEQVQRMNKYKDLKGSLGVPILKERIWQWIKQRGPLKVYEQAGFRFPLSRIPQLTHEFIAHWILYAYFTKFSWTLRQFHPTHSLLLSYQLKQQYHSYTLQQPIDDLTFNFIVVYCVKLIGGFLPTCIEHIEIDTVLQSELCIIFHHVLLGICMGTKTFSILENKYCFAAPQCVQTESKRSIMKKSPVTSTHTPITTKLISTHFKKQHYKTKQVRTSIANSHSPHIDHFIALLKDNLYVDSLPQVVKNKINIREYDQLHEPPQTDPPRLTNYIHSNQVSAATQIECLKKALAFSVGVSAKMTHTLQSKPFQKVEAVSKKTTRQQTVHVADQNSPSCKAKTPVDWNQIIKQIKNIQITRAKPHHRNLKKQLKAVEQFGSESSQKTITEHLRVSQGVYDCVKTETDSVLPCLRKEMTDSLLGTNAMLKECCEMRTAYENRVLKVETPRKNNRLTSLCQNRKEFLRDSCCLAEQ